MASESANNDNNNEQPPPQNREHLNLKVKAQDGTEVCAALQSFCIYHKAF